MIYVGMGEQMGLLLIELVFMNLVAFSMKDCNICYVNILK